LQRTLDLRIVVVLTKAWLHQQGLAGLARGLAFLQQLLSLRWGSVHPQLGAQGDTDGLMRVNALRGLCDARSVLAPLRAAGLVRARGLRTLSLRDLEQALAAKSQPDGSATDMTLVEASFIGCDLEELAQTQRTAADARAAALALEQLFAEHHTPAVLRLSELVAQLDAIEAQLGPRVRARRAALVVHEPEPEAAEVVAESAPGATVLVRAPRNGAVQSREEVVRELDRLCAYYDTHEPSSPVPILLRRAKRVAGMSFMELVRELAPNGISQMEALRGQETTEES
jgi:type VI secretion system protein ImpA